MKKIYTLNAKELKVGNFICTCADYKTSLEVIKKLKEVYPSNRYVVK